MQKSGNIGIIADFLFPYIYNFFLYLHHVIVMNVKLDVNGY